MVEAEELSGGDGRMKDASSPSAASASPNVQQAQAQVEDEDSIIDDDVDDIERGTLPRRTESTRFTLTWTLKPATTDALVFATRMALTMALGSLLVLLPPALGASEWPEAAWVYVTAGIVSWQAGPDTAPVFKKLVERIMGTMCGAVLGLAIGFVSMAVAGAVTGGDDRDDEDGDKDGTSYLRAQAIILGILLPMVVFLGTFLVTKAGYRGSYVSTLTNVTIGLVVLAFFGTTGDDNDGDDGDDEPRGRPPWTHGLYRVLNIFIGCAIAGVVTCLVRPFSTHHQIRAKVEKLSKLTGKSVRAVMEATIALSKHQRHEQQQQPHQQQQLHERRSKTDMRRADSGSSLEQDQSRPFLPTITELVRHPETAGSDDAHDSYIASIDLWRDCRQALQLLRYDPVFRSQFDKKEQRLFQEHLRLRMARLFRIQVVLVMMDSLLRGGLHRGDSNGNAPEMLETIGKHIETLLDPAASETMRNKAAKLLVQRDIVKVRQHVRLLQQKQSCALTAARQSTSFSSSSSSSSEAEPPNEDLDGDELWSILGTFDHPFPLSKLEGPGQSSLFYRLLEHVILKAVRLHHANEAFDEERSRASG